jgi:transmembrane sensor
MEWNSQRITELTWKYLMDDLSSEERVELETWLADPYNRARFEERIKPENILEGIMFLRSGEEELSGVETRILQNNDMKIIPLGERIRENRRQRHWLAAAAALAVISGTAIWYYGRDSQSDEKIPVFAKANLLAPAKDKAVLTLGNGKTVALGDAGNGTIARQEGSEAVKVDSGELVYHNNGAARAVENTIATPRGGGFRVMLPDGTKVWLNAASKITFPTAFTGSKRMVSVEGEAYMEVASDAAHPFVVSCRNTIVQVLGTSFDLMAYPDENGVRTSLASGAVEVNSGEAKTRLKPGQQADVVSGKIAVDECDLGQVLAWKNGFLDFRAADIQTVMRAVSRWWDVDVVFPDKATTERFSGQLNKSLTGEEALKILTASGYHFQVKGKTIIVLP